MAPCKRRWTFEAMWAMTVLLFLIGIAGVAGNEMIVAEDGASKPPLRGNPTNITQHIKFLIAASQVPMFQGAIQFQTYCTPILVILGLIGNTLSLFVMLQRKNRKISCCAYMTVLAICDNGSLLMLGFYWVVTLIGMVWERNACVTWVYFVFLMTAGSGFLLVGVTFDRFMAVCYPLKARAWCTPRRARIICACIMAFVAIFYIPMAIMSNVVDVNVCAAFRMDVWPVTNTALAVVNLLALPVIPFFVILVMNVKIVLAVRRSEKFVLKAGGRGQAETAAAGNNAPEGQSTRDRQLTIMLLVVSCAYLVIILPISCRVVAYLFIDIYASPYDYALFVCLFVVLNHVLFLNNTINFYLYYVTGSRFRRDLKHLLLGVFSKCKSKSTADQGQQMSSSGSSAAFYRPVPKKNDNTVVTTVSADVVKRDDE